MTRKEFADGVRAELDKLRFYPRETDLQFWIDSIPYYCAGPSTKYFKAKARAFRAQHAAQGPVTRRGRLPVAPEDIT